MQLDEIDLRIIKELQQDAKQSIKQLAEKVNLSVTPTHERIKKIENSGIIQKYVALVNPTKVDKNLIAYCHITLVKHQEAFLKKFEDFMDALDEVIEVSYIGGNYDFLIKIVLKDMDEYQNFVIKKVAQLDVISNIQSSFVLKQSKSTTQIKVS